MSMNTQKEPEATDGDRELAEKLVRVINGSLRAVIPNDLPNISFADNCANTFEKAIASHVAARLAHVEAERDALSKDRDSWKVMAECLDVKVLHEQIDHNKTIDGPLALARAERDALRATVAKMRGNLQRIELMIPTDRNERTGERGIFHDEQPDSPGGFLPYDCDELAEEILNYVRSALRAQGDKL